MFFCQTEEDEFEGFDEDEFEGFDRDGRAGKGKSQDMPDLKIAKVSLLHSYAFHFSMKNNVRQSYQNGHKAETQWFWRASANNILCLLIL